MGYATGHPTDRESAATGRGEGRAGTSERREMSDVTEAPTSGALPEVCTPRQWAEFFKVSPKTVYRMCEEGRLHTVKVRGSLRICRDKSLALMGVSL